MYNNNYNFYILLTFVGKYIIIYAFDCYINKKYMFNQCYS